MQFEFRGGDPRLVIACEKERAPDCPRGNPGKAHFPDFERQVLHQSRQEGVLKERGKEQGKDAETEEKKNGTYGKEDKFLFHEGCLVLIMAKNHRLFSGNGRENWSCLESRLPV